MPQSVQNTPASLSTRTGFFAELWRGWIKPIGVVILVLSTFRSAVADWNDVPSGSMLPTIQIGDRIVVNKLAYGFHFPFSGPHIGIPFTRHQWNNPLGGLPSWSWDMPLRGDIITFWSPETKPGGSMDGTRLVKRVVAVAGDTVKWTADGRLILITAGGERLAAAYTDPQRETIHLVDESRRRRKVDVVQYDETIGGDARRIYLEDDPTVGPNLRPFPGNPRAHGPNQPDGTYKVPPGHVWAMGDNRDFSGDSRKLHLGAVPIANITGRVFGVAFSMPPKGDRQSFLRWDRICRPLD